MYSIKNVTFIFFLMVLLFSCSPSRFNPLHLEYLVYMSDSAALCTDVYVPGKGKYPTILVRTPYNKETEKWMGKAFGLYKINIVIQDVRGRYKSEGTFYPFLNERADGLKTIDWIKKQPWSNGKIGGWGGSYVGYTQWCISDSLDFLSPVLSGADIFDLFYPDGVFSLQSAFTWAAHNSSSTETSIAYEKIRKAYNILPLSAAADSIGGAEFIHDWLAHEREDAYWKNLNYRGITKAPVLSIAGWYDIFLMAQIKDFLSLPERNPASRLVIGPWCHGKQAYPNEYGGLKKTGNPRKIFAYTVKVCKGRKARLSTPLTDAPINLFIMERNEYVGADTWPPKETQLTPFYLHPDRTLQESTGQTNDSIAFLYNPSLPFPSSGGTVLGDSAGPALQNRTENRNDMVIFDKQIDSIPLILLGPVSATLYLSSNVKCTDAVVCLQDVFPDGKIINIQEGAAHIEFEKKLPEPKKVSVWATGYQVNPGHKLRVIITSSWFPRFNRNLNACNDIKTATQVLPARQVLFLGSTYPSCIHLPVYQPITR